MSPVKIFSGDNSKRLAEKIASAYGQSLGEVTIQRFSDGEMSPFYNKSIRGSNVFLIQSTNPPANNLMELLLLVDAAKRASAKHVTVAIPYFGYARQDRKDKPRITIGAKLVANLLTSAGTDRVMTMDLHAGQIQGFFDIPVDHLDSSAIFLPWINSLRLENLIFASPDVGGTGRARKYAKHIKVDMVICDKYRARSNEVTSMQIIGDVKGRDVVLVDDIADTASTITKAADIVMEKGAKSVRAICTHPVLSGKAYENIEKSTLQEIAVSDTVSLRKDSSKIKVLSVAELFAKAIRKIHDHESISSLFI